MKLKLSETNESVCRELGRLFAAEGEKLHLVGGAVRDALLGRAREADLDFTTSATPSKIRRAVRPAASVCYDKSGAKGYGTMGVKLRAGLEVEITPYRLSSGLGGKLESASTDAPVATFGQDLMGRDFTINAIAADLSPERFLEIDDPGGGFADIAAKHLRTPLAPALTFEDDPLRLVRAVRFATLLEFEIEKETLAAINVLAAAIPCPLDRTAAERIREELLRMMQLERPSDAVRLLRETGLLRLILPEIEVLAGLVPEPDAHHKDVFEHTLAVADRVRADVGPDDPELVFGALLHDIGKPASRTLEQGCYAFRGHEKTGAELAGELCKRLRLSNAQTDRIRGMILLSHRLSGYDGGWSDAAVRRALHELGGLYADVQVLSGADITTSDPEKRRARRDALQELVQRAETLRDEHVLNPRPPIDGLEIMQLLGLEKGGPQVGLAVKYLNELIISGELNPGDADAAREIVTTRKWQNKI